MKSIIVWLHVFVGIIWIGLLYYFNFVQVPAVGEAIKDGNPGPQAINQYVAPRALAWFRYGALLTWLTGVFAIEIVYGGGSTMKVFMLQGPFAVIGVGAWLGTIMFLNVWGLIWTNQKKILNLGKYKDSPVSDDEKAQAKTIALMASRANTLLSIPMIMCMIGGGIGHGLPF
ncbi:MAG: urate hydroxylase PuuD [Candidatus Oxydemutatoraceae bacterium WSBS_2016_MAG_OTU14]